MEVNVLLAKDTFSVCWLKGILKSYFQLCYSTRRLSWSQSQLHSEWGNYLELEATGDRCCCNQVQGNKPKGVSRCIPINAFIMWQAPRAGKIRRILCSDWLNLVSKMERYCSLWIARFVAAITFRLIPSGCTKLFFRKIFPVTVKRFSMISLSR